MGTILSVDDSAIIRKIIRSAVDTLGFAFAEAENGQEALDYVADNLNHLELVIMDWNMPVMDGYTALQQIKSNPVTGHIPVMMVTTEIERASIIKAIQAGAGNYLVKPFTQEDLLVKIMDSLGKRSIPAAEGMG